VFIFKTGFHSVLQFGNSLDYTNCNLGNAIALYETGDDVVPLPTPGTYYFGCGFERHCSEYFIKLKINVVAASAPGPLAAAGGGGASPAPSPDQFLGACTGVTAAGGCIPTALKSGSASSVGVIAGCVVGAACLLLVAGIAAVVVGKRRNHHKQLLSRTKSRRHHIGASLGAAAMGSGGIGFLDGPRMFTYKELSMATKGFSSSFLLGQGGFGSVYKGVLRDNNTLVAVKQIAKDSRQGAAEFLAEVSIISKIRHRNLVRLQGWCQEGEKLFIVYDHMHNGSLDKFLIPEEEEDGRGGGGGMAAAAATTVAERPILSWSQRYNILCGVAAALAYLHEEWEQCILHRDIKPSNVLLDSKFNAYLGDFGMARLLEHSKKAHTTFVAGTMGYLAPELPHTRKANTKTDIFSFGVLMLEVTCGRRPFDPNLPEEEVYLLDWVWSLHQSSSLPLCVDPRLVEAYDLMQSKLVLQLGLLCSHPDPDSRPSMRFVRQVLSGDISLPSLPASKPEISYTWKNTGLITGGGVGGVLPIRESTSMVGSEPASSLDSQDQRLMDVSI
jgi:interleukin-1 receptor-associated kinase 1